MKRGIVCVAAALTLTGYHALGHLTLLSIHGVNPWPAIRAGLALSLAAVISLALLIEHGNRHHRRHQ